ncbi:acetyltransferase [Vibrio cholerae]|nr:acetyltransferase [Vibrio cholerae]ELT5929730.1 acetyltransferase [Vibrio cholerae]KAA1195828.1 acetyltransferase [Vibrio cholerae]KAA1204942.1 acetyltransferase [Vibrio cholerae]KAA1217248.1 acetyltransferase [Vibrio cholerae]
MVAVVVFEFSVMRCQPLRRALAAYWKTCSFSCTSWVVNTILVP